MQVILAKNWWSLVIRGLAAIVMGVITAVRNAISIDDLTLLFFVYALFDGLVGIAGAVRAGEAHSRWTTLMIEGLTGIGAAVAVITLQATGAVLPLESVIAAWALATGVLGLQPPGSCEVISQGSGCSLSAVPRPWPWGS